MLALRRTAAFAAPTAARAYAAAAAKTASPAHTKGSAAPRPAWAQGLPSLGHLLDAQVVRKRTHRDCVRLCGQDERWTYEETITAANAVGAGLLDNRVLPGKRLAISVGSESEAVSTFYGACKSGAVASWINPELGNDALVASLKAVKPRGIIVKPTYERRDLLEAVRTVVPESNDIQHGEVLRSRTMPELKTLVHTLRAHVQGFISMKDLLVYDPMPHPLPEVAEQLNPEAVSYQYNDASGNAAQFSQNQLIDAAFNVGNALGLKEDRVCIGLDFATPSAQTIGLAAAAHDSLTILPAASFSADLFIREAARERASVVVLTPKRAAAALESSRLSREDLTSLHTVVLVGSPGDVSDSELVRKVQNGFEVANVVVGFTAEGANSPFLLSKADGTADNAVGRAVPNTEVKIADANGAAVALGQTGALMSKGAHVAQSFLQGPSKALAADGWLHAGVQARMDGKGNVFLS